MPLLPTRPYPGARPLPHSGHLLRASLDGSARPLS